MKSYNRIYDALCTVLIIDLAVIVLDLMFSRQLAGVLRAWLSIT